MILNHRNTCLLSLPTFFTLYLPQSLLVEAKVVGYLMAHYFLYFYFNFIANAALRLYGLKMLILSGKTIPYLSQVPCVPQM
jgi:hypothetical protein